MQMAMPDLPGKEKSMTAHSDAPLTLKTAVHFSAEKKWSVVKKNGNDNYHPTKDVMA